MGKKAICSILWEAIVREGAKGGFNNWSKQARVLCNLLDEAREEFDAAVRARDIAGEQRAFAEMLEIAKLLDEAMRCSDEEVDDLLM